MCALGKCDIVGVKGGLLQPCVVLWQHLADVLNSVIVYALHR